MERIWLKHYEAGVPQTIAYPHVPMHAVLEKTAEKWPGNVAMHFMGARITFGQLKEMVDRFAAALAALGVKKGDRVAVHLPNCPQFVIAYYGTLRVGGVVVSTNPLYVERELEFQLNNSGSEVIVTLSALYPRVARIKPNTRLRHVIVANIKDFFPPVLKFLFTLLKEKKEGHRVILERGAHTFVDLLQKYSGTRPPAVEVKSEDVACFLYTGGTTGVPKGAVLTHENLVANALQTRNWMKDIQDGRELILSALPFFHSYGMTTCMNLSAVSGAGMVLLPRFTLEDMLKAINKYRPTLFPGVPTMYVAINNAPDVSKFDLRSIRACISGAAALPVEVQEKFEQLTGGRLVEGYGLSEASPVTHCNPIYGLRKAGSIGVPFPDTEAKIVDTETGAKEMPVGEAGELVVRGPQVMKEYWRMPDETKATLRNGWLYTGDVAKMDEGGYFFIVDRKKDMIIAGGFNIYPREVEEVLYMHPKIKEAVAVGVPDEYRGEAVKAYVVLKEGERATAQELIEFCKERLAKYKVPTVIEFRDSLPKTMVGKILRRALVEEEKKKLLERKPQG